MFSSSNTGFAVPSWARMSRIHLTQEQIEEMKRKYQAAEQARKNLIKKGAIEIFSNPDLLKNSLEKAVTDYLIKIKDEWFRNDGRKRAEEFIKKMTSLKTTGQLILVLKEVINEGNEKEDSLKTFIFNAINLTFFDNKLYHCDFAFQLKEIINKITEIKMLYDKNIILFSAMQNKTSPFYNVPIDVIKKISVKLNNS